jgi:hypothetical protein
MTSHRSARQLGGVAVTIAVLATGAVSVACAGNKNNAPSSTTTTTTATTTTSAPAPSPTQNRPVLPTSGASFTPPVTATPPPQTTHRVREYPY